MNLPTPIAAMVEFVQRVAGVFQSRKSSDRKN